MESPMLKMLKIQNPEKEYPSNTGKKWTDDEERLLLQELNKNMEIELIAKKHNRTIGGINSRRKDIAYKLYSNNNSMEEIILKTKLDEDQIIETIKKRQNNPKKYETENKKRFVIESAIYEIKNDIKELKNTMKEIIELMNAVYEFEDKYK
jgi:hypothetical protein